MKCGYRKNFQFLSASKNIVNSLHYPLDTLYYSKANMNSNSYFPIVLHTCVDTWAFNRQLWYRPYLTFQVPRGCRGHCGDVIMGAIASQITSLAIVYSTVYSDADQRKHQSSASLAFVRGIHRGPVNSPHKWPVTRKMFPFDDVIMVVDITFFFKRWFGIIGSRRNLTENKCIVVIITAPADGLVSLCLYSR